MILTSKTWYDKVEYYEKNINPQDFIDCKDEDELYKYLQLILENSEPIREKIYDYESDFQLPDEFINEWNKLKNNDN